MMDSRLPATPESPIKMEEMGKRELQEDAPARPPPKKRRRIVISCTECHRRKQKCDRNLPCTNCISRSKQDACRYELGVPNKDARKKSANTDVTPIEQPVEESLTGKGVDFGYNHQTASSTLGFLEKIDGDSGAAAQGLASLGRKLSGDAPADHFGMRERYKSLIRQLPARIYLDKLVDIYFSQFNWQYYALDQDIFMKQMNEWNNLPFNLLSTQGPQALPPDLRAFPALLFEVIATALFAVQAGADPTFDALKYAGNMTFDDLAMDYSESGVAVLSLLGKRQMCLTTVLAGFVRSAFLKYTGLVTEAWHAIGSAIRDAQEIGLHKDSRDPKPISDSAEAILENQWEIQRRRRAWAILVGWDVHTGIVLGRPTTIDRSIPTILPVDAPIPKDRSKTPVIPRGENDPPTPLTRALWAFEAMMPLRDIIELEKEGPCPKNFARVEELHQSLIDMERRTPAYFRLENPDTRFDDHPECGWLKSVRATLPQLTSFDFMALHRPYIFTRPQSRTEALKACIVMLQAQRSHFQSLKPHQYKTFSLFFGTFDAIVLMASLYILFPKEHPELLSSAMQHFRWSVERFEAMSEFNTLAKSAVSVLNAIYIRLKKSLGVDLAPVSTTALPLTSSPAPLLLHQRAGSMPIGMETPVSMVDSINIDPTLTATAPSGGSISGASGVFSPGAESAVAFGTGLNTATTTPMDSPPGLDLNIPPDFDWSSIQPIYAMGDLAYNDLMGIGMDGSTAGYASFATTPESVAQPWTFEGDFQDNSLWNVLNQFAVH